MKPRKETWLIALLVVSGVTSLTKAQTAREVARKAFPSVVLILAPQAKGKTVSLGSGFFVNDGIVATNYHVVKGSRTLYAKLIGKEESFAFAKVLATDTEKDLALLSVPGLLASALKLAESDLEVGDEVYAIGNPEGLEGTLSQGIVSGIREIGGRHYIQITAAISHGSSGGPILNKNGEVVGIAVA